MKGLIELDKLNIFGSMFCFGVLSHTASDRGCSCGLLILLKTYSMFCRKHLKWLIIHWITVRWFLQYFWNIPFCNIAFFWNFDMFNELLLWVAGGQIYFSNIEIIRQLVFEIFIQRSCSLMTIFLLYIFICFVGNI